MEPRHPHFFGEWLKQRRKELDLTQAELSQQAGCSIHALRKIESGERRPSKQLAELLADPLAIPPDQIPVFIRVARGQLNLARLGTPAVARTTGQPLSSVRQPPPNNLPHQLTPLLGRDTELAAIQRLFHNPQCRLLTLTGGGGIGKTRLAVESADRDRQNFPGGVLYIPLAGSDSAESVVPAAAEALGLVFSGTSNTREQLLSHIRKYHPQPLLMVLDNCEHLLTRPDGTGDNSLADLVSELLQRLPRLVILATSRERLNLQGEWTYELHGLSVPDDLDTSHPAQYGALALFTHSARRSRVEFMLGPDNQPDVIRICRLLDGNPLAIELAAAWVGVLPCREILREVESNIDFLGSSMRNLPARHRSIRASFDHSWRLLGTPEQQALSRLSVFRGEFERLAARQIAGATLDHLASLAAKSLLNCSEAGRYQLHEVIRQFALDRLSSDPSAGEIFARHSQWYLQFVARREQALKSAGQQEALREIMSDLDNIRAAWQYAHQHGLYEHIERALRAFGWFFEVAGLLNEGLELLQPLTSPRQLGALAHTRPRLCGLACMQQGLLHFRKGHFTRAFQCYQAGVQYLRPLQDHALLADALTFLGILLHLKGEYERAYACLTEALECAQAAADDWSIAYANFNIGYIDSLLGNTMQGYTRMLAGLQTWRKIGDPHSITLGLNYIVPTLVQLKSFGEARAYMQESIQKSRQCRDNWGLGSAYRFNGLILLAEGDYPAAEEELQKSLDVFCDFLTGWDIACTLSYLAEARRLAGQPELARQTYLEALSIAMESDAHPIALEVLLGLAYLQASKGEYEQALRLSYYSFTDPAATRQTQQRAQDLITSLGVYERSRTFSPCTSSDQPFDQFVHEILGRKQA